MRTFFIITSLFTALHSFAVRFWDVEKGVNTLTLFGFEKELYTVSLANAGNRVVITETDGTVYVFDL
jgi:WD40 repeat protein